MSDDFDTAFDAEFGPDEPAAKANGAAAPMTYRLLSELRPNLTSNEIVKDLIPRRAFGEVHADAGGGKTAVAVDLLLHVAGGLTYRERRTEQQPVVYVALEGHGGIDNRIIAAARELEIDDAPFALVKSTDNFCDPETTEKVAAIATNLMKRFGGNNPVIAIDTYTAALGPGGSDCDPKDVSAFIAAIQQYLLGSCTVVVLHHFGKDSSRGGRGWSGLRAALDFELEIDCDEDLRTMRVTKSRDGSDRQAACCYRLHGREIGVNEHGEPVTAVVVEHLADEDVAKRGKRHSPKARAALNVLWECIKDPGCSFPLPDNPRIRCVLLEDWQKACSVPGTISSAPREADRARRFRDAQNELIAADAIICDGESEKRVRPTPKQAGAHQCAEQN